MLEQGRILSNEAVRELHHAYLVFRSGMNRLAAAALEQGVCRWAIRPKHHYVEHLYYDLVPLNGRYLSNYVNEDAVRRIKYIAAGSHAAFLSAHVSFKYTLQFCLRWR